MSSKKRRDVVAELLTPPHEDKVPNVYLPPACPDRAALLIGDGITDRQRLTDGRNKYYQLRQMLLDEQVAAMSRNFRFKDVSRTA